MKVSLYIFFEAEVERNDDDDICVLLPDDSPDEEVPEEKEIDVTRDIDAQEKGVLTDELPRTQDS